jgi:hypothetical protein
VISGPSAAYQSSLDRVCAFVMGSDGHVYVTFWDGSQWVWQDLGAPPQPASMNMLDAVYQASADRLHVFSSVAFPAPDPFNDTHGWYDTYWNGAAGAWAWENLQAPDAGNGIDFPAAVYQASTGQVHVFGTDLSEGRLYETFGDGFPWIWRDLGSPGQAETEGSLYLWLSGVYQTPADRVHVFVATTEGFLFDNFGIGSGRTWRSLGPPMTVLDGGSSGIMSLAAVFQPSIDEVLAFVIDSGGGLYGNFAGNWITPAPGTPPGVSLDRGFSMLSASYRAAADQVHVFAVGSDGHLYDYFGNESGWAWADLGTPATAPSVTSPSAVYQTSIDRMHVFVAGSDGRLYVAFWNGAGWTWQDRGIRPVNPPKVELDQASISFGALGLGDVSPVRAVSVRNTGSGPVSMSATSLTGANASDFEITQNSCTGSLGSGQTCTVGVVFSPGAAGVRHAALEFADSAGIQQVALAGQGIKRPVEH